MLAPIATTDEALVTAAANGTPDAFGELYRRHRDAVYRYCLGIVRCPDDAHDAVQVTMTRALIALERREAPSSWRPWLFSIAHNVSVELLRRRRSHGELRDAETVAAIPFERRVESRERLAAVLADLGQLPERQRSALVLRELRGLSDDEIGRALAISSSGVRQAVFEARSALKDFSRGRELECASVLALIAGGDGRSLRARHVRAHLRACPECRAARGGAKVAVAGWLAPVWLQDLVSRVSGAGDLVAASSPAGKVALAAIAATMVGAGAARTAGTGQQTPQAARGATLERVAKAPAPVAQDAPSVRHPRTATPARRTRRVTI